MLVNFKQEISSKINAQVIGLSNALEPRDVVKFVVPSYCSLVVGFDPSVTEISTIKELVEATFNSLKSEKKEGARHFRLPISYDEIFALDMQEIQKISGLSTAEIIELHCSRRYRVFGVGFLPGFPYLGKVVKKLACPRRLEPRLSVPSRSVGIAGRQTGIYPADTPGGWQIIGRTPIPVFRPLDENPFLLQPGDHVSFEPITEKDYHRIEEEIEADAFDWQKLLL